MPELTAGSLRATLENAALTDVTVAGRPALDTVYVAVRDADWGTVPAAVTSSRTRDGAAEFEVRHLLGGIDFRWHGTVQPTGTGLRFTMDGVAGTSFDANRIGFCLLHPQALRGRTVRVRTPRGEQAGTFPERISPHQLFTDVQAMTYEVGGGARLEIAFDGDLFEVEDHRNWSDPGWKTYCTPLSAPWPVRHPAGRRLRQVVDLRAYPSRPPTAARRTAAAETARVTVGKTVTGTVPQLGLGACCLPEPDDAAQAAVRELRPAYLHVELEYGGPWRSRLDRAAAEASALGVPLDVALVVAPDQVTAMSGQVARAAGSFGRISVFSPARHTTDAGTVTAARDALRHAGLSVPVGGGSRAHLAELNRGEFDLQTWDFAVYGLTPQVHHTDDESILATADAVADGLAQARVLALGRPVVAGPVTLRPRFNAASGQPDPLPLADDDGPDADPRQHTQLAAVYLAAALSRLTGACAVTAFRTIGRRGVITADGRTTPAAGIVSVLTPLEGAGVRQVQCTGGLTALAVEGSPGLHILATNRARGSIRVELDDLTVSEAAILGGGALDPARLVLPPRSVAVIRAARPRR